MTVTVNRRGEIVLQTNLREKPCVKSGDILVAVHDRAGRIVLQKHSPERPKTPSTNKYLTPPALPPTVLKHLYAKTNSDWEKVEAEAVTINRHALTGKKLEDL